MFNNVSTQIIPCFTSIRVLKSEEIYSSHSFLPWPLMWILCIKKWAHLYMMSPFWTMEAMEYSSFRLNRFVSIHKMLVISDDECCCWFPKSPVLIDVCEELPVGDSFEDTVVFIHLRTLSIWPCLLSSAIFMLSGVKVLQRTAKPWGISVLCSSKQHKKMSQFGTFIYFY